MGGGGQYLSIWIYIQIVYVHNIIKNTINFLYGLYFSPNNKANYKLGLFEKGKPAMKLDVNLCIFNRKMLDPRIQRCKKTQLSEGIDSAFGSFFWRGRENIRQFCLRKTK